jgi:uncharacterized protein
VTEENRRLNVQFEWEKAAATFLAVEALLERNLWADAISRAYYGIFHLARALLFSQGLEAKSHSGMIHLLSAHLVRTGDFPTTMVRAFSHMQRLREDADYQSAMSFDRDTAEDAKRTFLDFQKEAESFLRAQGHLQ